MKYSKSLIILCLFFLSTKGVSQQTQKKDSLNKAWYIPDYAKVQFAGNIGFLSVGAGYQLFNDVLYTELLYGFVPKSISKAENIHLITLKNTFPIYRKKFGDYTFTPIAGLTTTIETGNNSFLRVPDIYPDGYYITNAVHFTFFVGALAHKDFKNKNIFKGVDFYFELGAVELFLFNMIANKEISPSDVFSGALGFNFYF